MKSWGLGRKRDGVPATYDQGCSLFAFKTVYLSVSLDAVIIGASSIKHLEDNIKSTKHGPLHEGAFDFSY